MTYEEVWTSEELEQELKKPVMNLFAVMSSSQIQSLTSHPYFLQAVNALSL